MAERLQHETFSELIDALKRYAELSGKYEDVRLEQFVLFGDNVHWSIEYRYIRH